MIERHIFLDFHIDTNRINSRSQLKYMNPLEQLHEREVIDIAMSEVAQKEATQSGDDDRTEKAYAYGATETLANTSNEVKKLREIQKLLFPQGIKSRREWNDVEIVFNAHKYGAVLITNDGGSKREPNGILGNAQKLRQIGIQVLRDYAAIELIKKKIIRRDQIAREIASTTGEPLPDWVGKDLNILEDT
jgi:hypothetical protein